VIVAHRKPMEEILQSLEGISRLVVCGCNSCVAVCHSGGENEVQILAAQIRIARQQAGQRIEVEELILERNCEPEFVEMARPAVERTEAMLNVSCGVGVNQVAEAYAPYRVIPGLNTTFYGAHVGEGVFEERCGGCGDCALDRTGGICPITRCAKSILNGPCGGSQNGKCEISKETDCAWQLIWDRLNAQGRLARYLELEPVKDWRPATAGGPRRLVQEVLLTDE